MQNLIDGVLQYSRIGGVAEEQLVDLNELIKEVIDSIAPSENISIEVENSLPQLLCEPTRLFQVFQNLLGNAVKYIDKPRGWIKIGCVREDNYWKFHVADNGPGIKEQDFERVFQIFQTLIPKDEFESTGVGLTVVKKAVELWGGNIWIESEVGRGSIFYFTVPIRTDRQTEPEHESVEQAT
jgi:signal transduction histidine kinase